LFALIRGAWLVLLFLPLMWSMVLPFAFLALMNGVRATAALDRLARLPQLP
jgi:hypothetical protein